jgi:clan AA aspartic protease
MIIGSVTSHLEAVFDLAIIGPQEQQIVRAVIDTGFDGWLTLPPSLIAGLALPWRRRGRGLLADGSECFFDIYEASVVWDGQPRRVAVDATGSAPLVGMSLLRGHELTVQVVDGGSVRIVPLPRP